MRQGGGGTPPAFYNFGGLSIGAQIGATGGSVIFLLMNRKAVDVFCSNNKFALTANAGLSVVTYSAGGQANLGRADVILLTNMRGACAGATIEASDIGFDGDRTREYYGRNIDQNALFDGPCRADNGIAHSFMVLVEVRLRRVKARRRGRFLLPCPRPVLPSAE